VQLSPKATLHGGIGPAKMSMSKLHTQIVASVGHAPLYRGKRRANSVNEERETSPLPVGMLVHHSRRMHGTPKAKDRQRGQKYGQASQNMTPLEAVSQHSVS